MPGRPKSMARRYPAASGASSASRPNSSRWRERKANTPISTSDSRLESQRPCRSRCGVRCCSPPPTRWAIMAGRDKRQPMPSRETGTQMEPETATAAMSAVLA